MDNRYNHRNRRKYSLKVHIVLVTKYRKQILKDSIADDAKQQIYDICNSKGYGIIAMETDKDHIHFLISYDTTDRVCDIVKFIKQQTTHYLWQKYPNFLSKCYWKHKDILVRWLFCLQYRRSILSNYTKIYREPRLMATNLQGSSHRPRAVGFRLRNRKDFIYE